MITKFKIFETIHQMPNNDDYIYSLNYGYGQIIKKYGNGYAVKWRNKETDGYIGLDGAYYWSENKEELEASVQAKKYNL